MLGHSIQYLAAYQSNPQVQDDRSQQDTTPEGEDSERKESEPEEKAMELYPEGRRIRAHHPLTHGRRRSYFAPVRTPYVPMSPQRWMPHQYPMSPGRLSPPLVSVPVMFQPLPWMVVHGRPMAPAPFWAHPTISRFPYL